MDQFPIDDMTPVQDMHLFELPNQELIMQHGGVATRVSFDEVKRMPLHYYLANMVPKADNSEPRCDVIRDYEHNNVTLILNDQVAVYHVTGVNDVAMRDLADALQVQKDFEFVPNIPFPLIYYKQTAEEKWITVAIEAKWFHYNSKRLGINGLKVMHPPLWLNVKLSNANVLLGARVAVVRNSELHWQDTKLYHLALPNVWHNHDICLGGTRILDQIDSPTMGQTIMLVYNQVFNSEWNLDLVMSDRVVKTVGEAFDKLKPESNPFKGLGYKAGVTTQASATAIKALLAVLTQPQGWRVATWQESDFTAESFVNWRNGR